MKAEDVYYKVLCELLNNKKSHNRLKEWHKIEEKWFDLEGLTTWDEDRQSTKKYLKDMGML